MRSLLGLSILFMFVTLLVVTGLGICLWRRRQAARRTGDQLPSAPSEEEGK